MRDAFVKELTRLAQKDPNVILITGDLGFGIFNDFVEKVPDQFLNVGVAEQNMTGVATGMALEGKKIVTYSIGNFATLRCLEQIRNDAAYHDANITIVASGGGFTYGQLGMSHHATEDLAILRALPGVTTVAPCTPWETKHATNQLVNAKGVGYLRIEKGGKDDPAPFSQSFELGKALKMREGSDITLMATGGILEEAMIAASLLAAQGLEARVLSFHTLKPIDKKAVLDAVSDTGALLTIEEHSVIGGLGGAVAETLMNENVYASCGQIGLQDQYSAVVGDQRYLRQHYKLDAEAIVAKAFSILELKKQAGK